MNRSTWPCHSEVQALQLGQGMEAGVYSTLMLTSSISLEVIVEKDFACLDRMCWGSLGRSTGWRKARYLYISGDEKGRCNVLR
jgi:hypothetical protein